MRSAQPSSIHVVSTHVFMNGNSQAVRIPQAFRMDCRQVEISRNADGDLVLHPVRTDERRGDALLRALAAFDAEFVQAREDDRRKQDAPQDREPL